MLIRRRFRIWISKEFLPVNEVRRAYYHKWEERIAVISEYTSCFTFAFIPYKNVNIKRESFLNSVLMNVLGVVKETILVHDSAVFWSIAPCLQNDESFATKSRNRQWAQLCQSYHYLFTHTGSLKLSNALIIFNVLTTQHSSTIDPLLGGTSLNMVIKRFYWSGFFNHRRAIWRGPGRYTWLFVLCLKLGLLYVPIEDCFYLQHTVFNFLCRSGVK